MSWAAFNRGLSSFVHFVVAEGCLQASNFNQLIPTDINRPPAGLGVTRGPGPVAPIIGSSFS